MLEFTVRLWLWSVREAHACDVVFRRGKADLFVEQMLYISAEGSGHQWSGLGLERGSSVVTGRSGQCRDQVPEQGARESLRKRVSERTTRHQRRRNCRHVSVCALPRLHHHRPHQHAPPVPHLQWTAPNPINQSTAIINMLIAMMSHSFEAIQVSRQCV